MILNYKDIDIYQDDQLVLGKVNFSVEEGEMVYLTGPVGSGKSSLLKSIYGELPVEGGKELVIVNLHLEAYDDGEGKAAQAQMLMDVFREETAKGNYVIAGGDFNQSFSNVKNDFAVYPEQWQPSFMDVSPFADDGEFLMDSKVASCRSLYKPLTGNEGTLQYYMIDGFIVSKNIRVESYEVKDLGFVNSDHNPQILKVVLE